MNLIKRNLPVIIIGLATLAILVVIIFASQRQKTQAPQLQTVEESQLVAEHTYIRGAQNGPITIVEFSDFQCPFCAQVNPYLKDVLAKYPTQVRLAYRHFPLPQHQYAKAAAEASQIAGEQGKFWEYTDLLFENQENMKKEDLLRYAKAVGLDEEKFKTQLESGSFSSVVAKDLNAGRSLGVNSTPTFYVNGQKLALNSFADLENKIAELVGQLPKDELPNTELIPAPDTSEATPPETLNSLQVDQTYGILEIAYTNDGFVPDDTTAYLGQKVRWTNKTDKQIKLVQTVSRFPELEGGITIAPGKTFEFRPNKDRLWGYREEFSGNTATIFIDTPLDIEEF